jgi:hypothetical protein
MLASLRLADSGSNSWVGCLLAQDKDLQLLQQPVNFSNEEPKTGSRPRFSVVLQDADVLCT